ncbi:MAG: hypothetical protein VX938_00760 [Myxococcota bacterium]|nr:hypothetical protein [Myxococcota bacterium]
MNTKSHGRRALGIVTSLSLLLSLFVVPSVTLSACGAAQRNPDARPGLRRRADENRRDLDRNIETERRKDRDNQ